MRARLLGAAPHDGAPKCNYPNANYPPTTHTEQAPCCRSAPAHDGAGPREARAEASHRKLRSNADNGRGRRGRYVTF